MKQGTKASALGQPWGIGWGGKLEVVSGMYQWPIHVDVWQKSSQYCQAILQLKQINFKINNGFNSLIKKFKTSKYLIERGAVSNEEKLREAEIQRKTGRNWDKQSPGRQKETYTRWDRKIEESETPRERGKERWRETRRKCKVGG